MRFAKSIKNTCGRVMIKPVYVDIHIHTSDNPDSLNAHYDVKSLLSGVEKMAQGNEALISLTDHNTINKSAYKELLLQASSKVHVLLGAELHIKNYDKAPAYHCHIIFDTPPNDDAIDKINDILDNLYPTKQVELDSEKIPHIERIINMFDGYEFVMLPHGGQSHSTFDKSIPRGTKFDSMLMRSIYYNQFDGFTARSDKGLDETIEYFKRLGISEFVNLVTCSDNYDPRRYPEAKDTNASPLLPTWMYAEPTFDGFRLSLSEKSRFDYKNEKPTLWSEYIRRVKLNNETIDIDVTFTPGLNVIIGGSSSGKTLLVDSIAHKLNKESFNESPYEKFRVSNIEVENPSSTRPHYLYQNYIMKVISNDSEKGIESIDMVSNAFPEDSELNEKMNEGIASLQSDVSSLMQCVEDIAKVEHDLRTIPSIPRLIINGEIRVNVLEPLLPTKDLRKTIQYKSTDYTKHSKTLQELRNFFRTNPFSINQDRAIDELEAEIERLYEISSLEDAINTVIEEASDDYDTFLRNKSDENQQKSKHQKLLLKNIRRYIELSKKFNGILSNIANYSLVAETKTIKSMGHKLSLENHFNLSKNKVLEVFNNCLSSGSQINSFVEITPKALYLDNYRKRAPKIMSYDDVVSYVVDSFSKMKKTKYRIETSDGRDFYDLSAGWKTSVLLDLILGYDKDMVPIIIDQPEDNLASAYINTGLVEAIKKTKVHKQIILVSHNATIPMLADAQNIIYCSNESGKIIIRSAALEGSINGVPVLDLIAKITDGGKPSIKKRVKKYNLKKYTES